MKRLSVIAAAAALALSSGAGAYDLGGLGGGGEGGMSSSGGSTGMSAEPSCAQVICLSPEPGSPPPAGCFPTRAVYFAIQIWNPYYNESATSNARRAYLMTCTTARQQDITTIQDNYGELMVDPMVY
jgi:hypothetical protein